MRQLLILALLALPVPSFAYMSVMDTGDLIQPNEYRAGLESQFVTSGDTGVNIVGRLDMGLNDEANLRAILGFGTTNFQTGFYYKWVPYPDMDNQPAIGFLAGVHLAQYANFNDLGVRFAPLVSKKFNTEHGTVSPYASLPMGLHSVDGKLRFPVQLALGTQWKPENLKNFVFLAEMGFNLNKAFNYISFNVYMEIDKDHGIEFK